MNSGVPASSLAVYRRLASVAGCAAALGGFLVLAGWTLDFAPLKSFVVGIDPMKPNAALCFVLSGIALVVAAQPVKQPSRRIASRILAGLVALVGLLTTAEYLSGLDLGIDQLLFRDSGVALAPGRMAFNTAFSLFLVGLALLLIDGRSRRAQWSGQGLAILASTVAVLALVGYAYGVEPLTGLNPYVRMAPHTAILLLVAVGGILAARPAQGMMGRITGDTVGGVLLRRLLPLVVGTPLLLGWGATVAERWVGSGPSDVTLLAVTSAAAFFALIWNASTHLERTDSERRHAQEALWESEARFKAAAEGSLDALFILETVRDSAGKAVDFRFVEVNSRGEKLLSTPRELLVGRKLCDLLPHNRTEGFFDRYVEVLDTGEPLEEEFPIAVKGINASWLRHQVTRLGDGIVITSRDVTERRRAQEDRERLANDLRLLLESTDEGLYGVDIGGLCTFINASAARMIGYAPEEAFGKNMHDLIHHTCSDGRPYLVDDCPIYEAFHEGRGVRRDDEVFWRKDGTSFHVEYSSYPVVEEGVTKGAVVAFSDITERREAEDAIRKLNDDLARRAAELAAANKELEAFSYSVSHDLRAPLRSIDGFSLALLEDYADGLDETGKDYLNRVRAASQRMGELIDDILQLSRLTRGEMRREEVNLSTLAHKVAADLLRSDRRRHVELVIEPDLVVNGDTRLLTIVVENLLGNAWKFTSQQPSARIEFGTIQSGGRTAFFVRDNGTGFDMAYVGKLFGAFQRLHAATDFPGNGIGLATVQRIVHRHGGKVWAEGEVGKGAAFYFTL